MLLLIPCAAQGVRIKGAILSRERMAPFKSPERKICIAGLGLEELHTLRNVSAVYMASP